MKNSNFNKKVLAIIPARGGSKGLPRKNIRILAGKPLIAHTIEEAKKSNYLERIIVSTEDKEIAEISKKYGAEVIERPEDLAQDSTPTFPVMEQVIQYLEKNENYKPDFVVLLQCTSPLRKVFQIDEAIEQFLKQGYDSLLSVCPFHAWRWRIEETGPISVDFDYKNKPRRQDLKPEYRENGAIYISGYKVLTEDRKIVAGKVGLYIMPEESSFDIDNEFDLWMCERIMEYRKEENKL